MMEGTPFWIWEAYFSGGSHGDMGVVFWVQMNFSKEAKDSNILEMKILKPSQWGESFVKEATRCFQK